MKTGGVKQKEDWYKSDSAALWVNSMVATWEGVSTHSLLLIIAKHRGSARLNNWIVEGVYVYGGMAEGGGVRPQPSRGLGGGRIGCKVEDGLGN